MTRDWLLEVTAHREADAFDRAIDLRITRLRRKVEVDPAGCLGGGRGGIGGFNDAEPQRRLPRPNYGSSGSPSPLDQVNIK